MARSFQSGGVARSIAPFDLAGRSSRRHRQLIAAGPVAALRFPAFRNQSGRAWRRGVLVRGEVVIRNRCSLSRVDARLLPLIEAAGAGIAACCGECITAVRLQGSVARGEARPGHADLDMIALLDGPPAPAVEECVAALAARLGASTDLVTRCDLEVIDGRDLAPFRRFVLMTDSFCLSGEDGLTALEVTMDRAALASLVTPDPAVMLPDYLDWANDLAGASEDEIRFASRTIGKDALKILRGVVLLRGAPYEVATPDLAAQIPQYAPEHAPLAAALLAHYQRPTSDAAAVVGLAQAALAALSDNCELASILTPERSDHASSPEVF
ncbi:MAG: nucleotidyltransferase domain-containing protein [Thermomicrobiales bacterium]